MTSGRFTIIVIAAALVATVALLVSGTDIGDKSDEERFRDAYEPISKKLDDLGQQVHNGLQSAETKNDRQLSEQFSGLADDLAEVRKEVDALQPPSAVEKDVSELEQAIENSEGSLRDIATAADEKDPRAASTATLVLVQQSERLDKVQKRVSRAADE